MAQYARYWSCSKFADWLRGTEKGSSKTGKVLKRADGKVLKPVGFSPPDLSNFI